VLIAIAGIPSKTQPATKNGTLQTKNRKPALASHKCTLNASPDRNHEIANVSNDNSIRVVSSALAIGLFEATYCLKARRACPRTSFWTQWGLMQSDPAVMTIAFGRYS
jgi:hypothetical protein